MSKIYSYRMKRFSISTEEEQESMEAWVNNLGDLGYRLFKIGVEGDSEGSSALIVMEDTDHEENYNAKEDVEIARKFLAVHPPAIQGQGGNEWTMRMLFRLKDIPLSEQMILELLMVDGGWNSRCIPPWSESELATMISMALRYGN